MDRENFFRALMTAMVVLMVWMLLTNVLVPPKPQTPQSEPDQTSLQADADTEENIPQDMKVSGAQEEKFVDLGNVHDAADSVFRSHIKLTNRGAALVSGRLTEHARSVGSEQRYQILSPVEISESQHFYSFLTEKINLDEKNDIPLKNRLWHLRTEKAATHERGVFWIDFEREGQAFARLTKTYTLRKRDPDAGHDDLIISLKYENLSASAQRIILTQLGPVGVAREDSRMDNRKITAGVEEEGRILAEQEQVAKVRFDKEPVRFLDEPEDELIWAAVGNKFFAVIMAPKKESDADAWIASAEAIKLSRSAEHHDDCTVRLATVPFEIESQGSIENSFECYLGPKSKILFTEDDDYARRSYILLVTGDYYWCAFAPIVNVMLWILNFCHSLIPNYGVAIIIMVLIVRTLLHPLTKKGQVNMTRMAKQMSELQPKMEEIRQKYAKDKQKLNQEIMKLYQQHGINPAGQMLTCIPMMLQMPIWGALWAALNFTVELRHQPFFLWINDLTAPDALVDFGHVVTTIPMVGPITAINILPPLLGISMWLQQKFMPKPAAQTRRDEKTPDQLKQQKIIMTFMSVFFVVIFYNAPSGLTLYIMASNFFGLFEQHRIRKHIREQEERAPAPGKKKKGDDKSNGWKFKKPRFIEKLEKLAEEAKKTH